MVDWLVVRHAVSKIEQPIAQAGSLIASYGFLSGVAHPLGTGVREGGSRARLLFL